MHFFMIIHLGHFPYFMFFFLVSEYLFFHCLQLNIVNAAGTLVLQQYNHFVQRHFT